MIGFRLFVSCQNAAATSRRLAFVLAVGAFGLAAAFAEADAVTTSVAENTPDRMVIDYALGDFVLQSVSIDGQEYVDITLGKESRLMTRGAPALPNINRSVVIPDDAQMEARVLDAEYYEIKDIDVAPSKGHILRSAAPADVPYILGEVYDVDAFYPGDLVKLGDPYIMRDHRGALVQVNPFQYNPVARTLRVYTDVTVEIVRTGDGGINVLEPKDRKLSLAFHDVYDRHFLNFDSDSRYAPLDEEGDLLIICYDSWISNVQPLVDHKNSIGIDTTVVGVSTIGNNSTSIKNYIQGVYDTTDLAFVLLVGDIDQVTAPTASGGASDPTYSKLAGDDNYPEIMVGRFSAETSAQVDTQVERTIEYENMPATTQDWFWRGTGIASNQGTGDDGEYDNEHMGYIRDDLLAYGYTIVDEIYDPSASASQVTTAINAGRGIVNYCGHGSITSWSSSNFNVSNVNALTNDNMLPFICSVACNNGEFDGYTTCFAETWLRATHGTEPTGAIGMYASSISQYWDPPMDAQDEFVDMYVSEAYTMLGTLLYAGSCHMMDEYPALSGDLSGLEMFNTWILFGDPSLRVVNSCSDAGTISLAKDEYACDSTAVISVNDCGLNTEDGVIDTATVTITSDTESGGESVLLTETEPASGQFVGSIDLSETNSPGILQVSEGDLVTATYIDVDDGQGGTNVVVTDTATVDCTPPNISNIRAEDVEPRSATIAFDADEPARGIAFYGLSCGSLTEEASGSAFQTAATVALTGLDDDTTYFYAIQAEDEAGNSVTDDNGGSCYTFTTPEVPDYFTELFEDSDNDLGNTTLVFIPNGSNDYYAGCAEPITELPTDPDGGTALTMTSADTYATVPLSGVEVLLYGEVYSTFYPASNGYITFDHGDTTYTESLDAHFGQPRISALFDDLNPSSTGGGTVSWKQLADRVAVTWEDVPEYTNTGSNTFQIELFFDGTIAISYLSISAQDGLAGLSEGTGLDPDFYETDLSEMGACGPRPPVADNVETATAVATPVTIALSATDDGLPDPPAALTYIVTSLPTYPLRDLGDNHLITSGDLPYTLVNGGNEVLYMPAYPYQGPDSFQFKANDGGDPGTGGGDSGVATVSITIGGIQLAHSFPMDSDPGWSTEGDWAFGQPTGGGGANGYDPSSGHTGTGVYGYNLDGNYANGIPTYYLTTPALDCSNLTGVELKFWKWLGIESGWYDHATVEVSSNGVSWTTLWEHDTASFCDTSWSQMEFDLSSVADNEPTVYLRWSMGTTDGTGAYPGWNIDDVEVWGFVPPAVGPPVSVTAVSSRRDHGSKAAQDLVINFPASVASENVTSESRDGGLEQLVIEFDAVPGACSSGDGCLLVEYQPGGAGTYPGDESSWSAFTGATVTFNSVVGNTLILDVSGLESCSTYRFTVGAEVTSVAEQVIEVRSLLGDMDSSGVTDALDKGPLYGVIVGSGFSVETDLNLDGVTNALDKGPLYATILGACNEAP